MYSKIIALSEGAIWHDISEEVYTYERIFPKYSGN